MHANYGGLLNGRLNVAREEDQQDAVVLDETQATATDEVTAETPVDAVVETPADVVAEVPAETPAVDTPADGDAFVDVVPAETGVDPSTAEATATGDVVETTLDVAAETPGEVVADTEPLADPLAETSLVDAPLEDAAAASVEPSVGETTADVTTDVDSGAVVDAGTDAGADVAADASAAATVDQGVDATGDTLAATVEETPATDGVVATTEVETPADVNVADTVEGEAAAADVEAAPVVDEVPAEAAAEVPADVNVAETPAEETPAEVAAETPADAVVETPAETVEETPADPVADAEVAAAAIPDLAVGSVVADPVAEEPDVGTVEGGATGEAGLTEEVAVNDGETNEVDQIDSSLLEEGVTEVDTDIDGVNAYDADITDMNDELDDVTDNAGKIEVAVESLRIIAQNGGLDRSGGTILNLHLQSLYANIPGMDAKSQRMSMEAFGGATMSKVDGTTLAMEEAKSNLRKILDHIVEMIQQGIEYIKEAFKKYFDESTALYVKAKKLKEQGTKTNGLPTVDSFVDNGLARALFIPGKGIRATEAASILSSEISKVMSSAEAGYAQAEVLISLIKSTGSVDAVASKIRGSFSAGDKVSAETVGINSVPDGAVVTRDRVLPGNRAVVSVYPASNNAPVSVLAASKIRLATFDTSMSPPEGAKLETLSKADAVSVANMVQRTLSYVLAFKKNMGSIDKVKGELLATVRAVAGQEGESASGLSQTDIVALAKCAAQFADQPASSFVPYALTTCRALLHYAEKSLAMHGATEAASAKAAA